MPRRLYWIGLCGLVTMSIAAAGCASEVQVSRIHTSRGYSKPRPDSSKVAVCFDHLPRSTVDYYSRGVFNVTTDNKGTGEGKDKVLGAAIAQVRKLGGDVLLVTKLDTLGISGSTEALETWNGSPGDEVGHSEYRYPERHIWYLRGEAFAFTGITSAGPGDAGVEVQVTRGLRYLHGDGVPQDDAQAMWWFGQAAEAGNDQAVVLLREAATHGVAGAIAMGTDMSSSTYGSRFGLSESELQSLRKVAVSQAMRWFYLAAQQGSGEGRKRLEQAAEHGNADAKRALGRLDKK